MWQMSTYIMAALGNPVFDIIETPYIRTNGRVLSGCSVNAALTIGKLGGKSIVIGTVGADYHEEMINKLKQYNVDSFTLLSKQTGGFFLRYLDSSMNDRLLKILGHADKIDIKKIPTEILEKSKSFLFGPILDELNLRSVEYIANKYKEKLIIVDPQGFIRVIDGNVIRREYTPDILDIIRLSDIFKPNEHEAEVIFGDMPFEKAVRKITKLGADTGIITLAERGALVSFDNKVFKVPAFSTVARDPTGCGDVFAGAFTYYMLKYNDPLESTAFACATASFMVETTGPDFDIRKKDLDERFNTILNDIKKVD